MYFVSGLIHVIKVTVLFLKNYKRYRPKDLPNCVDQKCTLGCYPFSLIICSEQSFRVCTVGPDLSFYVSIIQTKRSFSSSIIYPSVLIACDPSCVYRNMYHETDTRHVPEMKITSGRYKDIKTS